MASIFVNAKAAVLTKEQKKVRRAAWKPSKARAEMQMSGTTVVIFRSPKAQAEHDARVAAAIAAKFAKTSSAKA